MCQICYLWEKGKLTPEEAYRALAELVNSKGEDVSVAEAEHFIKTSDKILEKLIPMDKKDK